MANISEAQFILLRWIHANPGCVVLFSGETARAKGLAMVADRRTWNRLEGYGQVYRNDKDCRAYLTFSGHLTISQNKESRNDARIPDPMP